VFVDEAGTLACVTREYGRAPVGEPAVEGAVRNRGGPVTMLAALTLEGLDAVWTFEGGTTADVFVAWVAECLLPELPENALVVMDNLAAHKDPRVAETLATVGAKPVLLPPYSPELNPIELAWAKLKRGIRTARPACREAIDNAIAWTMELIEPDDAANWFRHCGWASAIAR
jgi:transposase